MDKEKPMDHKKVIVHASDLPLRCPPKGTPTVYSHPHQWFDITKTGAVMCPYCSTHYVYEGDIPENDEMYEGTNHVIPGT